MIEPARTAANAKLKANIKMVKNLVHAANEEQQLGLTELREKASAATWHLGNCIVAVHKLEANVTEISLRVAHRQANYRWVLGLQPDELARVKWNWLMRLVSEGVSETSLLLLDHPQPRFRSDVAHLVDSRRMSELARLVHIHKIAEAQFGVDSSGRASHQSIEYVQKQIAQAQAFKQEQDAIPDLAPAQLADQFWQLQWAGKPPGKTVRRHTFVPLNPPPIKPKLKEGELPDVLSMQKIYKDYNPETAKSILNALAPAWEIKELHGGRWGRGMIAQCVSIAPGTISHYLKAFREAGLREWGNIKLP